MKSFLPILVLAMLPLTACETDVNDPIEEASIAQGAAPVAVFRSVQRGNSASGGTWSELGGFSVDVWETSTGSAMWFNIYAVDPTSHYCETVPFLPKGGGPVEYFEQCWYTRSTSTWGGGQIAAADVESLTDRFFSIHTDVSNSPDFVAETCSYDHLTGAGACVPLSNAGRVDIEWTGNNTSSYFSSGVSHFKSGTSSSRSNGNYRSRSADFSGALLGAPVSGNGAIGRGMNVSKDLYRE